VTARVFVMQSVTPLRALYGKNCINAKAYRLKTVIGGAVPRNTRKISALPLEKHATWKSVATNSFLNFHVGCFCYV
jgi:hypothetical protein